MRAKPSRMGLAPLREGSRGPPHPFRHMGLFEEGASSEPGRGPSEGSHAAYTLVLDSQQPPEP